MKKWLRIILVILVIVIPIIGAYLLIFDHKDHCLDYGGTYNEITKQCEQ